MPDFCCAFGCSKKRKTGSKSNISYYRIPFNTDPEEKIGQTIKLTTQEYVASILSVVSQRKLQWLAEV